jgi:hypothetical protein
MNRYCKRYEAKQTDVAIAVSVLVDAKRNDYDRVILITADSDQIPLVKALKEEFPMKSITLAAPPERGQEARELGSLVHERIPITPGRLSSCFLARNLIDDKGNTVARKPAEYATANGNVVPV